MAVKMDKNQQQTEEEIDCMYCRRSRDLPPPRLSIAGRRPTAATKKNVSTAGKGSNVCDEPELIIPFKSIKVGDEIGRGSYGRVFGISCGKAQYAAKELHTIFADSREGRGGIGSTKANFIRECHIWSQLRHPCIVQFIGMYYPAKDKLPVIVMEKMQWTLTDLVEKYSKLSCSKAGTILNDVCLGLQYLHSRTPPIIHRDLTPNNILLCYHYRAKITDLGVARTLKKTDTKLTQIPGTAIFMPPECLGDKPNYDLSLDVFSFGGIVLYITTQQWPSPSPWVSFDPVTNERIFCTSEVQRRQQYIDKMTGAYADLKPLVTSCLDDNPKKRPLVTEVLTKIKQLKKASEKRELYFDIWSEGDEQLLSESQKQLEQNQEHCQSSQHQKELKQGQQGEQQNHQSEQDQSQQQEQTQQHEKTMKEEHQQKSIQPFLTDEKKLEEISKAVNDILGAIDPQTATVLSPPSTPNPSHPLFIAKYDFSSEMDGDLSFKKGDLLYIINRDKENWWFAKAKDSGQEGHIPFNYVTKYKAPKVAPKVAPKPVPEVSQYPLYRGKYDYFSEDDKYLSFKKGDLMYMLNMVEEDWWFATSKQTGQEGYVPNNYVAAFNTLDAEDWFFGAITRKHAENLLMQPFNDSGSFLIRNSESTSGDYSLSIKFTKVVRHYRIKQSSRGYSISNWMVTFGSIPELVAHYSKKSNGLCVNLRSACLITRPKTASLSEEANQTLEVDRSSIRFDKKLGEGKFGEVWQAAWNGPTKVAVKKLHPGTISANEFFEEVSLTKQLRHVKLVQLYGVCTTEEPIYIITELMKHGSLLTYLRGHGAQLLKVPELLNIGAQVASGMAYLEQKGYIHRELAARNVLVSESLNCKVKSISMARILSEDVYEAYTGEKFPVKWTAPEALLHHHFTIKSDVWSFGILLYELITFGCSPYPGMTNGQVLETLQTGYRMPCPRGCPEQLYEIMKDCWKDDAPSRPTFETLHWRMEDFSTENEPTHLYPHQVK